MKIIAWAIVFIIAGVAAWQYIVNKKDRIAAEAYTASIEAKLTATEKGYAEYRIRSDSALSNAKATAIQAGETAKQSQSEVDQYRGQVKKLLVLLDNAEKETPDSTWLQVSPNYKFGCDSLRRANAGLNNLVDQYEQDNQAHVDALNYETYIRDSALQKEREFSNTFRAQLVYCISALSKAEKPKGKTQLYAGMAAWGNAITPLGGGEINLGLKTPGDQFYEIKGAYLGKWWVGVGTKFKLSF
jgi:hypothetical protein